MSTKTEIDHVLRQMQHGVRKMTPLVAEQQPERDRVKFPKPAMVVRERWSRSSYQEQMEKRVIEIALEEGMSMEEIDEIRAMTNRDRPVMTPEEEKQRRLEMLEECRRMLDRWDEEDEYKRQKEETLVVGDLSEKVKFNRESLKKIDLIQVSEKTDSFLIPLMVASEKYSTLRHTCDGENKGNLDLRIEQYYERGKAGMDELFEYENTEGKEEHQQGGDKWPKTEMSSCAYQLFDQMPKRRKRVAKKKKRWKKLFSDIEEQVTEILIYEENGNLKMLGIQMEGTSKRQRKQVLEWCKGVSCQWIHTRQRLDRKWLLRFRTKKNNKMRMAEKNYESYERSERYKEAARAMLRNMIRCWHYHEIKDTAERVDKKVSVEIKIHTDQVFGRMLLLNVTKAKKKIMKLEQQEKKCNKSNKMGNYCGSMTQKTMKYKIQNNKHELEQKKLEKWLKHRFKQKTIMLSALVLSAALLRGRTKWVRRKQKVKWVNGRKSKYKPGEIYLKCDNMLQLKGLMLQTWKMTGAEARYKCVNSGQLLSPVAIVWMKFLMEVGTKQSLASGKRVKFREQDKTMEMKFCLAEKEKTEEWYLKLWTSRVRNKVRISRGRVTFLLTSSFEFKDLKTLLAEWNEEHHVPQSVIGIGLQLKNAFKSQNMRRMKGCKRVTGCCVVFDELLWWETHVIGKWTAVGNFILYMRVELTWQNYGENVELLLLMMSSTYMTVGKHSMTWLLVYLSSRKWLHLNGLEKMNRELFLATDARRRAKWKFNHWVLGKFLLLVTVGGIKFGVVREKQKLETWSREVSWKEQVTRKYQLCFRTIWEALQHKGNEDMVELFQELVATDLKHLVPCFNLEDKITPAHDPNDFELGKRHNLEFINIFTDDGKINTNGGADFTGMPRFAAREAVVEALKNQGLYRGAQNKEMRLGLCQRTSDVIEPMIKPQWYVNCSMIAKEALDVATSDENKKLEFLPKQYTAEWRRWLENPRDWCISRQLWWGHRIPAWYATLEEDQLREIGAYNDHWVVARTEEEARKEAAEKFSGKKFDLTQDHDVLDTWFSSGIFPLSVLGWPDETDDFKAFYPTSVLETGHDILFFWVARMVMMGMKLSGDVPFSKVYLHPMIRDAHGRKMSKSLGNVIDPIEVIDGATLEALHKRLEKGNLDRRELVVAKEGQVKDFPNGISECGADALRFALVSYTAQSDKINLDILRVVGYRQWCNKLWNAVRFALIRLGDGYSPPLVLSPETMPFSCQWILSMLNKAISKTVESLNAFEFSDAANTVYAWWQYQFCDVYIEAIKPYFGAAGDNNPALASERSHAQHTLWVSLETGLRLLHPFMPFVTEELWQRLPSPKNSERKASIMICDYPSAIENWTNEKVESEMETVLASVKCLRALRAELLEKQKNEKLPAFALCENNLTSEIVKSHELEIRTLANLSSLEVLLKGEHSAPAGSAVETVNENLKVYLKVDRAINAEAEQEKIRNKIAELQKQKEKLQKIMSASGYEEKVPANVKEDNVTKLAKILQEFDFFEKESARLVAETGEFRK